MDSMVLETQEWLNATYGGDKRYKEVEETGKTGWPTINGLILAFQIELGIQNTAPNFGENTINHFNKKYPEGIKQQNENDKTKNNVYSIIQGALWCKGYSTGSHISGNFYEGTASAIIELKEDMGIGGDSTVTLNIMEALLSMKQFVLLWRYGGTDSIREIQQKLNRDYPDYLGIIPTDGLYGREMNTALIKVLQAEEGLSPSSATGNFGDETKKRLIEININNYKDNLPMFKVAFFALLCLGYAPGPDEYSWTTALDNALLDFQNDYGLKQSPTINIDTWMSLLTSKGNTDRKVIACDTRFELTYDLIVELQKDGYQIVGRYLTGGDYKEIKDGELRRIIDTGLKYFPIFQENARELKDFSYTIGLEHGKKAVISALDKGIPNTVIYFAIDMDILDYQIDSHIIPYFKGINRGVNNMYGVGIYASRNVCTRVSQAGYAISSFVSDMSTGFSGNLGFRIPGNWNYDQIFEIEGYGKKWDLDKVVYSGKIPPVSTVYLSDEEYSAHKIEKYDISNLKNNINEVILLIKELEKIYDIYRIATLSDTSNAVQSMLDKQNTYLGVLNYLSKFYLQSYKFAATAQPLNSKFIAYMKLKHKDIYDKFEIFIGEERIDVKDNINGKNDIAHLAFTILTYLTDSLIPDYLAGWGGDLATGASNVNIYSLKYPGINKEKLAYSIIGADKNNPSRFIIDNKIELNRIDCNYTDLCDDADAIGISGMIRKRGNGTHVLSESMELYHKDLTQSIRFSQYGKDSIDITTPGLIYDSIKRRFSGVLEKTALGLLKMFFEDATEDDKNLAYKAFSEYIYRKINDIYIHEEGWKFINNNWRYFDKKTGKPVISEWKWVELLDNKGEPTNKYNWKYFDSNGNSITQIYTENGSSWLSQAGSKTEYLRGWWENPQNGSKYYFRLSSGTMVKGEQYIEGAWRYFRGSGTMATGWQKIGINWKYYRKGTGTRVTGRQFIDGKWYEFDKDGALLGSRF
ncbi:glycoside hydrolase domain-containing protein [Helcococcus kunzii]|uniref:glycoside hydrolase domain-containing protein n=1 Tax=Helcococcus kunzii TaxID=40091 RepID=UPI0024ADBCFF|nr:glycoside hydrolase domain-containing protein [Helcococcus kunzii]